MRFVRVNNLFLNMRNIIKFELKKCKGPPRYSSCEFCDCYRPNKIKCDNFIVKTYYHCPNGTSNTPSDISMKFLTEERALRWLDNNLNRNGSVNCHGKNI